MPTDPRAGETLDLFPRVTEPPLLVLLRELVTGTGPRGQSSHPCPGGVTLDYLVWASGDRQPEDRDAVADEINRLWRAGRVTRTVEGDDYGGALWRVAE